MVLFRQARKTPDAELMALCREGDYTAFDEIVRRYKDRLYTVVYRFLGNREDAEDVTQEAFVRAYRAIEQFQGGAQPYTWLYRIAVNGAKNRVRAGHRKGRDQAASLDALREAAPAFADEAAMAATNPRDHAQRRELDETLQRCLNELPEHYREAFVLRSVEKMTYDEIAEALECPVGTVRSRLSTARKMLKERLEELRLL